MPRQLRIVAYPIGGLQPLYYRLLASLKPLTNLTNILFMLSNWIMSQRLLGKAAQS